MNELNLLLLFPGKHSMFYIQCLTSKWREVHSCWMVERGWQSGHSSYLLMCTVSIYLVIVLPGICVIF
jgi:hypothetical protein